MIHGVSIRPLSRIPDERGEVRHMLRADDPWFERFGEIYFSTANPGWIKGWHLHRVMTLNYAVVSGEILLVLYDAREGSPTRGEVLEIRSGGAEYSLITVPPGVWNAFRALGGPATVANCASHPHDPAEIARLDPRSPEIPYAWRD